MQLPPAHTHVAAVVEWETQRILHEAGERGEIGIAVDTDQTHGVIDHLHTQFRGIDLGHDRELVAAAFSAIELVAGLPGQITGRFETHLEIGQHVTDVLVFNNGHCA